MKSDFAVGLAPDQPNWQAAPQFASGRLIADPAVEAGPKDIEFRFAHRALQSEQEAIIEQRRVINSVGVADQRVGQTT